MRPFFASFLPLAFVFLSVAASAQSSDEVAAPDRLDAQIDRLIAELGANEYATREKAQLELKQLGLRAFESLDQAQSHKDIEIALRARYLLRAMEIHWSQEDDPAEVREILKKYDEQERVERGSRMERLADLPDWQGTEALCRLALYERSNRLSKKAALLLIGQQRPEDVERQRKLSLMISERSRRSRRLAATWLRTYAQTLLNPASTVDRWAELIKQQEAELGEESDPQDTEILLSLLRWQSDLLRDLGREEDALAAMSRTIALQTDDREKLANTLDWLTDRKAWPVVDELVAKFPETFTGDSMLLYRLAEARLKQGDVEEAQKTAQDAFDNEVSRIELRLVQALQLQERGMFEWAEREYRHAIENAGEASPAALRSRLLLSEMLHDTLNEKEAAVVLQGAVDVIEKDPNALRILARMRDPGATRSRMHYFYAEQHRLDGEFEKQAERLKKAIAADPTDGDVLIAMHRYEAADEEWKKETKRLIKEAAAKFSEYIADYRRKALHMPRGSFDQELAMYCNQYAWLVGNTEGDYQRALKLSHESLELRPNTAGYLDTLGRCYYAVGDLKNAVKYQSRAVELEKHSGQIVRQLEFFKSELEKKRL